MTSTLQQLAATGLMAFIGCGVAGAADIPAAPEPPVEVPIATNEWTFVVAPYVWTPDMSGSVGVFGLPPQDIDLSIGDVLNDLQGALMLVGQARNGPWSVGLDFMYSQLGSAVATPFGVAADNIDVTSTLWVVTAVGGYSVLLDPKYNLDLVAGARLWSADNEFEFNGGLLDGRSRSDGATWVDPVIGTKFRAALGETSFYVSGWGLIGGFGAGSDFMWDVMGGVGYDFTDSISAFAGYRAMGVDYSDDGFVFDVTMQGPIIGAAFRF